MRLLFIFPLIFFMAGLMMEASALPADTKKTLPPLVVTSEVDRAEATTGDVITYTVTFNRDLKLNDIQLPEIGQGISGFRIIEFGKVEPERDENREIEKKWYKLQADVSGSYILPAIELRYLDKYNKERIAKTSEIFVEIKPETGPAGSGPDGKPAESDIRDIKSLEDSPRGLLFWLTLGGSVFFVVLTALVIFFFKRRKRAPDVISIPPHEKALESLERLKNSNFLEERQIKKFHFSLSELLRLYFEERYSIPATDRTNEELIPEVMNFDSIEKREKKQFVHILKKTDLVKFTDYEMQNKESLKLLLEAENFVSQTQPVSQVEEESVV